MGRHRPPHPPDHAGHPVGVRTRLLGPVVHRGDGLSSEAGAARPWGQLARDLDEAHAKATGAAAAGLADAALGPLRLSGAGVQELAEAAVSSATPFLRAPLLARLHAAGRLHPDTDGTCPSCGVPAPCPTALALFGGS